MTDKYYGVYFDRWELKVDKDGHLQNPEAIHIIEFEYDEETDEVLAVRRVNEQGEVLEENPDLTDLEHAWYGDDPSIKEACGHFWKWLEDNLLWAEKSPATRWEPSEWVCIGIDGCIDDGNPY